MRPVLIGYLLQEAEAGRASVALLVCLVGQMVDARAATLSSLMVVLLCAERVTR